MGNPATRLLTLLMLLQRQPNQKAADLAQTLGVSVRSLHRYIAHLDEMGIPIYSERGPYGGFSLVRGYKMPPLVLSPEEAVSVYLGTTLVSQMWGQLYQEAAQSALAKLDNVLPEPQRDEIAWARRALVTVGMHRPQLDALAPLLETVRRALREHRRVKLVYKSQGQINPTNRQVDPYALVHRWGWWYLAGYCHLRRAIRFFRLDRVIELRLTARAFAEPPNVDIQELLAHEFELVPQIQARLRFAPSAGLLVQDTRALWETCQEQPDGSLIVTFHSPDLQWATSTVLGFGPIVTVLEPAELRRNVSDWARAIARQYEEGKL